MRKFIIDTHERESAKNSFEIKKINGWTEAYKDCQGDLSYTDGYLSGFEDGYTSAIIDVKRYLKQLIKDKNDVKISELINNIVI